MNPILRNVLAVLVGAIVGGLLNSGIIQLSPSVFPYPEGIDMNDIGSIKANIHLFTGGNFLMTWLAHAAGTLVGAFITAKLAASNQKALAVLIGGLFIIGGIMAAMMIGGPVWFTAVDILTAYIPMAFLGWKLAGSPTSANPLS